MTSKATKPILALALIAVFGCSVESSVVFRNRGLHAVWVERAEVGGVDEPPGFLGSGGGGKGIALLDAARNVLGSTATICWRHNDLWNERLRCGAVRLTRKCLPRGYRPTRDDLMFEVGDQVLTVGVEFADRHSTDEPVWSRCAVTYSGNEWQ